MGINPLLEFSVTAIELLAIACAAALAVASWAYRADNPDVEPSQIEKWIANQLASAGIDGDVQAIRGWVIVGATAAGFGLLAIGLEPIRVVAGLVLIFVLGVLLLRERAKRTAASFSHQLGEALPVVAAGLRSGLTLTAALTSYCANAENPIKSEFQRVARDVTVGIPFHEALASMADRMKSKDARQLAIAVEIQAQTGSGLADIIDQLAGSIKERERLRAKAASLTSTNRMSAKLLTLLPIGLLAFFIATNDQFRGYYLSADGFPVLLVLGGMLATGSVILNRMTDFKVE